MGAVTFQTIPGSGLELIPGGSPDFNQLVAEHYGPNPFRTLEPIVPYLVIVRNNSHDPIISINMRLSPPSNLLIIAVFDVRFSNVKPLAPEGKGMALIFPEGIAEVLGEQRILT
jgi:hypothetical protein